MAHWKEEYSAALAARDRREKANIAIYDAYTQLADRTGRIGAAASNPQSPVPAEGGQQVPTDISGSRSGRQTSGSQDPSLQESLLATRADLAEAQRSRSELQERLARVTTELEKLQKRNTQDGRRIHAYGSEVAHLQLRLKDRDEELRGKAKLLEDFQDELASLNLQLNMAEERSSRLQRENQELVDRWMARMGREAEAMNAASQFS
ncbi:ATG16 family protein [Aspergillus ibericus CBS 121593]|uniref:Autophagy protein 16 n=1 Tax=Aspergillus ibericus CBS 121593 TaxID=1448316 RepID=A0A395GZV3_9EURO|nr:autophagy protein 16 [Aspergillus ibericus CBS 121593]RAL00890.1 autophagy protein 16 [Aspergillus ibericus CBS 121593]